MDFNSLKVFLKSNKITNVLYNCMKYLYYHLYIFFHRHSYTNIQEKVSKIHIKSILDTVYTLIYSNKSLGRFGDGELSWILNENTGINEFEKPSKHLSHCLKRVLNSKDTNFMVGLPNPFISFINLKEFPKDYWTKFIIKKMPNIVRYMDLNKTFYNSMVTRPYMDFVNKKDAGLVFYLMKKIWTNKKVLIIEGTKSRLGVKDDLLNNTKIIKRIECPPTNAFESYHQILHTSIDFLNKHNDFLTLISLGPTATILAYDLSKNGFRAIDTGNIDTEYCWYKLGVDTKVNLPYHYVNEAIGGHHVKPINNNMYNKEVISRVNF